MKTSSPPLPLHLRKAREFIQAHLDEADKLAAGRISQEIGISKYHLHHEFRAHFGLSLGLYIRLLKLERAAMQLAYRQQPVLQIALEAGFSSDMTFSRAFKKHFACTPTDFRKNPDWPALERLRNTLLDTASKSTTVQRNDVQVLESPPLQLAVMNHRGDPSGLYKTLKRFISWRQSAGLRPDQWDTYNILFTPLDIIPAENFQMGIATVTPAPIHTTTDKITNTFFPAGLCACIEIRGGDELLLPAINYFYQIWLPQSRYRPAGPPPLLRRIQMFPNVPTAQALSELRILVQPTA